MSDAPAISSRKADHLDLCTDGDVGFRRKTNLFEAIELVHDALPEVAVAEVDLTTEFAGKTLKAPLVIAAMTGGVDRADAINRDLATVAEELGIGFAFGSQRPLLSTRDLCSRQRSRAARGSTLASPTQLVPCHAASRVHCSGAPPLRKHSRRVL